ncbi:MAG: hypothetical protein B6I24_08240 [Bacteroidetes bacterium 4572_128]|nr:MAG: hypothetical protein B6I24_08240 [Bacteroidetes bacterium 4572_128]
MCGENTASQGINKNKIIMIIMIKLINVLLGKKITLTKDKSKLFITQITMMFFLSFVVIFCMNLLNQPSNNSNGKKQI